MRYRNKGAWGALILLTALGGSAVLAHQAAPVAPAAGVPSVPPPPQDTTPPPDLPVGAGPSATSQAGPAAARYDEVGYASWYGDELRGRRTASGEVFNPDWITAASRTLPLGSFAEVTALDSGRTVLVEITDRGPHRPDRLIDLSVGAAKLLGVDRKAVAAVRVRQVDPPAADQVALEQGQPAAPRLDAPAVLLAGLARAAGRAARSAHHSAAASKGNRRRATAGQAGRFLSGAGTAGRAAVAQAGCR